MLIYVCCLSVVLCHRRVLIDFFIGQDWPIHYLYILRLGEGRCFISQLSPNDRLCQVRHDG